jgi:glycosyltransferase involved in cell wall biosynthesis
MARPVITTDVPGCRSVVDAGRSGLLCAVRDGADLARVCLDFIHLPLDAKRAMGQGGRQKMAAEYDQRLVVEAYTRAIADVTGRHAARAS